MDTVLINTLADGAFHSGQRLGELLGVSRTAVWKHLQKLADLGLEVESVKGRGYRIRGGLELLDAAAIRSAIAPGVEPLLHSLQVQSVIESTNGWLAAREEAVQAAVLAEYQSRGRGRRGRAWSSPFGKNIYLSVAWQYDGGAAVLEGLSLAVGVAVRRALGEVPGLGLKWPNDVLFENRKVAGILLEMQGDPSGQCRVVVGIGVNHGMRGRQRPDIDQPWADATEFCDWDRNTIAARLLSELVPVLEGFGNTGFRRYRDEWNRYDLCRDRPVRLLTPAREIEGIARGVGEFGAILIEHGGQTVSYNGGEVTLRVVR